MSDDARLRRKATNAGSSIEELAALYVAGAMTLEERTDFESRLLNDAQAFSEVASYDGVAESLIAQIEPVRPAEFALQSLLARIEFEDSTNPGDLGTSPSAVIRRANADDWREMDIPGVFTRLLWADENSQRMSLLMKMEPGASFPAHAHEQDEECLMLAGDLDFGDYALKAGDYLRVAAGTEHGVARTRNGCLCLVTAALRDDLAA